MRLAPLLVAVAAVALGACPERRDGEGKAPVEDTTTGSRLASPTPTGERGELVFVYSAGGDVYGETVEGERVVLAAGDADEVWPSLSPDGTELLYQGGPGPAGHIVHVDLDTGTKSRLGEGEYPSFGPDGRAAWVVNNATDAPLIVVGRPFSEPVAEITPIARWDGAMLVAPPIAWDLEGRYLYYSAGWEETSELFQTDSRGDHDPFPMLQEMGLESPGVHLLGPHVLGRHAVHVFGACCMKAIEDPWEDFEVGRVRFTEAGGAYDEVLELPRALLDENFPGRHPQVVGLGYLWRDEETGRWSRSAERSWIVGNAVEAWLVSPDGRVQNLGDALVRRYGYPTQDRGGIPGTFAGWGSGSL